jgi:hypothetical protein
MGGALRNAEGQPLREHALDTIARGELWNIPFGKSVTHEVALSGGEAPPGAEVRARWCYRRYNPEFSRWAWKDPNKLFPTHVLASVDALAP